MPKRAFVEQDVWELALERMHNAFKLFDTIAVAFSGGKDSTVCLQVTLEVAKQIGWKKKIPVAFVDEEAIPYQTEHYMRRCAERFKDQIEMWWFCVPVKHRNGCSRKHPYWWPWTPSEKDLWVRPLPPEGITEWPGFPKGYHEGYTIPDMNGLLFPPQKYGQVGFVFGVRAQESLRRLGVFLRSGGREYPYIVQYVPDGLTVPVMKERGLQNHNLFKVYPIYDWNTEDVWTAPQKFGWDYNEAYDVMSRAGITPFAQRCAPPYGEEPMQALWTFQTCFPDIWGKMQQRVPGADCASRYAKTPLYGFREYPERMKGKTWKESIVHYLNRHDEGSRSIIGRRVRLAIDTHYQKTKDPIVAYAPHPITGMSWSWLAMISFRGDMKQRRVPPFADISKPNDPATIKAWDEYRAEAATWKEDS